ncbi:MAG: alanine racemase [Synergistaceae bacterium]|nr:alanine racemase [Synergistaceae bacterium]
MGKSFRPTRMEVNLKNLRANFCSIRSYVKGREIYAVVKANAYGHGAVETANALIEEGCKYFAVATPDEAIELRSAGITNPILVLGAYEYSSAEELVHLDITAACTDVKFALAMSKAAEKQGKTAKLHIKIDSGMGRVGFTVSEFKDAIERILPLSSIDIEGVFTHFAAADESRPDWTNHQFSEYKKALTIIRQKGLNVKRHVCNSAGILGHPDKHLDMVRPGIALYGMMPSSETVCAYPITLLPTFEVKTRIVLIRSLPAGTGISYGLRYITRGKEHLAVLPIGYADGITRALSGKMSVLIHGQRCPVVGTICMDQMMVNVTGIENVKIGDEAVIIGKQGDNIILPEEMAYERNTINYEIPTIIQRRVPKIYMQ